MKPPTSVGKPKDAGETLLELLVAIVVIGIAVVALLGAVATAVRVSGAHRDQALAQAQLRAFETKLQSIVASSPTGYVACASAGTYDGVYVPTDGRFEADVAAVAYWDGTSAFGPTCGTDSGVQRLSLVIGRAGVSGDVVERSELVIRRPCRPRSEYPLDTSCG